LLTISVVAHHEVSLQKQLPDSRKPQMHGPDSTSLLAFRLVMLYPKCAYKLQATR
jgi:hypothetical protein